MLNYIIALQLPQGARSRLASLCYGIPNALWDAEESLIASLFPLGKLDDATLDDVKDALKNITMPPVTVVLSGIQHTAAGRSQARIWVGLESTPSLENLQKQLHSQLHELGIHPGKENLVPHVQLGIVPTKPFHRVADYLASTADFSHPPLVCNSLHLMAVKLSPKGTYYSPIGVYPLA